MEGKRKEKKRKGGGKQASGGEVGGKVKKKGKRIEMKKLVPFGL